MTVARTRESAHERALAQSLPDMFVSVVAGLYHTLGRLARHARGQPARIRSPDRDLLEQRLLPAFGRDPDIRRVLFVGCATYTQHYPSMLPAAEHWTLDADPLRRRYGISRHIIAPLQHLTPDATGGLLDLIVCNGVLGWGLDSPDNAQSAMDACRQTLRSGGYLLLGWNDVFPRNRVKPEQIPALASFEHADYDGFAARIRVRSANRHVYDLYRAPGSGSTRFATAMRSSPSQA